MPEEGIETQELKENLEEAAEKAEEQRAPWLTWLSLKEDMYKALVPLAPRPEVAAEWVKKAGEEDEQKAEKKSEAEKLVAEVKSADVESRQHLTLHHQFAKSVTIFQVAIALAAIAALARRKALWWVSLGVGLLGAVFLVLGFLPH